MRRSSANEVRVLSRRCKVAELLLRGVANQFEICRRLGMEESQRSTISGDIAAIKVQWRESGIRDYDEAKGRELDELDLLQKTAWEAWERSKTIKQTRKVKRKRQSDGKGRGRTVGDAATDGEPEQPPLDANLDNDGAAAVGILADTPDEPANEQSPSPAAVIVVETETTKEARDGNPAFLETVLRCIDRRCKILGIDSPLKVAPTSPDGQTPWAPALKDLSEVELSVVEKLAERMRQVATGESPAGSQEN